MSNFHSPTAIAQVLRRNDGRERAPVEVPSMIADYQQHMRGVDLCDQQVGNYLPVLKSFKWWRR